MNFLRNTRAHANPLTIGLNVAVIILAGVTLYINPQISGLKMLTIFAVALLAIQMVHLMVFGGNPLGLILGGIVIIGSAILLKLSLGAGSFVVRNQFLLVFGLTAIYLIREAID